MAFGAAHGVLPRKQTRACIGVHDCIGINHYSVLVPDFIGMLPYMDKQIVLLAYIWDHLHELDSGAT